MKRPEPHLRVLAIPPFFRPVPDKYVEFFSRHGIAVDSAAVAQTMREAELLRIIGRYDGVICGDDEFTAPVIEEGARHRLKVIAKWGVGIDSIDVSAAIRLGVMVCRSPGALSDAVADAAWGYIIMLARRLHESDRLVRQGHWQKVMGVTLRGRVLGIIGVGSIGTQVALRGLAFGMHLLGNDIREIEGDFLERAQMTMRPKGELLVQSDFVVLACDLNPTSYHLMGRDEFARMKPTAFLVNVARGALIDTPAAVEALASRQIAGAAFDVHEEEPLPQGSPLLRCPNTLLNTHNAFNADRAVEFVNDNTVRQLLNALLPGVHVGF